MAVPEVEEQQQPPQVQEGGEATAPVQLSTGTLPKRGREEDGDKKWAGWPGDSVFRLIVPVQKVGSIIGRKGEFVKKMCEDTRSRIKILEGVPGTSERIVMVSAREDPEAAISPAMEGLLRVHRRVTEGSNPESADGEVAEGGPPIASRLLVAATQAGSLIGRQGATIKSIQDATGVTVRVLPAEELPLCALADDRVVEIQGDAQHVQRAMELVVSHLRKFLVDRSVLPLFELNRAVTSNAQQQSGGAMWQSSNTVMQQQQQQQQPSYASANDTSFYPTATELAQHHQQQQQEQHMQQHLHHGVSMYGRDPGMASVVAPLPAPIITQVTQHMQIPLSYADAIIGTAGANISYMRRTSSATITIQETRGVPGEMTVEIHGSAAQVQTAQQLIQNFMAGATSAASAAYNNSADTSYSSYPSQAPMYSTAPATTGLTPAAYGSHYNTSYGY